MIKWISWACVALCFWAGSAGAQRRLDDAAIKRILAERLDDKRRGVGLVVGVIDAAGRQVVSHGEMRRDGGQAPDGRTLFEIGSITKVFTSILLAEMAARGEVALDEPVVDLLPAGVGVPGSEDRVITLRDLATHRSGLPRLPSNFAPADLANPYIDYGVEALYGFLGGYQLPRAVGAQFEYSNLGVGLLAHALALRAGTDYESLLVERVLAPLGLDDTRIALAGDLRARLAPGHNFGGWPVPNWTFQSLVGMGDLRSTTEDLLTFLAANMGLVETELAPALGATHQRQDAAFPGMGIGLGWFIINAGGNNILWHDGGTGGYRTFAGFDPDRQLGVVVLGNSEHEVADIGLNIFDNLFQLAPLSALPELAVETLDAYVGTYELAPEFFLAVTREGGRLFVQATGQQRFELFAETETRFVQPQVAAQITFIADADGLFGEVRLVQPGVDVVGRRVPASTLVAETFAAALPEDSALDQNYPNPFNSGTVVPFSLAAAAEVEVAVYNMRGQRVATLASGRRQAGQYALHWDGRDDAGRALASGMYLYRLRIAGAAVATRKLTLVR